jgi:phosphate starvation-inducible PhoH-like protein
LRIIVRGDYIKLVGTEEEINLCEKRLDLLIIQFEKFGKINEETVTGIMGEEQNSNNTNETQADDVLVFGRHGKLIKALTINQKSMVDSIEKNDLLFAIGPAGTGKTYTAVALAVRALKNKQVKKIILARPAIEAGENLGFLPGDMKDKLDPYLQPLYDALRDMLSTQKFLSYLEDETIEVAPLAFMRGRTLSNAFAILDEAQNASESQLKMFLTRMGKSSKFIVTGDITQIDLPKQKLSGLLQAENLLSDIKGVEFVYLDKRDVVRHKLVTRIIEAYSKIDDKNKKL